MANQDSILKLIDDDRKMRSKLGDRYLPALMENITQIRGLIKHFVTISSGIIGFSIPIFGRTDLIKSETLFIGGLLELLVLVLFGFYYLTRKLQEENTDLWRQFQSYHQCIDRVAEARNEWLKEIQNQERLEHYQKVAKEEVGKVNNKLKREKKKEDHTLDIIFFAFFIALGLIIASMLSIKK